MRCRSGSKPRLDWRGSSACLLSVRLLDFPWASPVAGRSVDWATAPQPSPCPRTTTGQHEEEAGLASEQTKVLTRTVRGHWWKHQNGQGRSGWTHSYRHPILQDDPNSIPLCKKAQLRGFYSVADPDLLSVCRKEPVERQFSNTDLSSITLLLLLLLLLVHGNIT